MKRNCILFYLIGLLALAGCQQEEFDTQDSDFKKVREGDKVELGFSLVTSEFNEVTTRMSIEAENNWDVVWVAQFKPDGVMAGSPKKYTNLDENITVEAVSGENTFYFVTNVDTNPFVKAQDVPITNISELSDCIFSIDDLGYFDTASKLAMVGMWKGPLVEEVLAPGDNTKLVLKKIVVFAKRLTSKINIIVDAELVNESFLNKTISIEKLQLCAAPLQASYAEGSKASSSDLVRDFEEETFTSQGPKGTYVSKTYYILENMHGDVSNSDGPKQKGSYAPKVAGKDLATHVKIRAFIDDGTNTGNVDYRVYLGKDDNKNFDIERNYHYTITIRIYGRGDITTDVRVESIDELYELQYRRPNNAPATTRGSETRQITAEDQYWGWTTAASSSSNSQDHLTVHTNGVPWTLASMTYVTAPAISGYVWSDLAMEYCAPSSVDWLTVVAGEPIPADSKIRIKTGLNLTASDRTVTFAVKLHGVDNSITREWRVQQRKSDSQFNMPSYSLFPAAAGVYSMAVRAAGPTMWRFSSKTSNLITFVGTTGNNGFKTDATEWQQGHGAILFSVTDRGNLTNNFATRDLGEIHVEYKGSDGETPTPVLARLFQLATAEKMLATITTGTYQFAYNYSSHSLFTTVVGFQYSNSNYPAAIPWALNMIDGPESNYSTDNRKVGVPSPVTGKENTLKIFNTLDKKAAEVLTTVPSHVNVVGTPIFTPAGICMSLNENYWEITDVNDSRFEWYLPSRNEALMDVMVSMLQLKRGGRGVNYTIWTSTTSTGSAVNAFFAGTGVDVSSNFSTASSVRCIRKKKEADMPELAYPYVKNVANTPVVVVREDGKGYVDTYRDKPAVINPWTRYYHIGYPLRYYKTPQGLVGFAPDGDGPVETLEWTLAPKFQVAKQDVGASMVWYVASGWAGNLDFKNLADPVTGCESYTETGENGVIYNDWRLPTELELRIMGLLGAGTSAAANDKILQRGGTLFSDIPGFILMNGRYWSGTEYQTATESGTRANYVEILDLNTNNAPIAGTATGRMNTAKVRCVRDIDRFQ